MAWMRRSLCAAVLTAIAHGGPEEYGHGGGHGGHGGHDGHGHTDGPRYKPEMMDFAGYVKGMDKDGDGLLSLEEAVSSITEIEGLEHPDHPEILEEKKRHVQKLTDNFKKSDSNHDGKLTFEEALMLLKHSGGIDVLWMENESYHRKQEL